MHVLPNCNLLLGDEGVTKDWWSDVPIMKSSNSPDRHLVGWEYNFLVDLAELIGVVAVTVD